MKLPHGHSDKNNAASHVGEAAFVSTRCDVIRR
jgi:hypothetical protein